MKARKTFVLLAMLAALCLLCTACATTAKDNLDSYYQQVGIVLDDWFASDVNTDNSESNDQPDNRLDAPGSFTLSENGDYSFTGVAGADYYLVYFCAPDATGDSDPFLFSSSSIDAVGTGGEVYEGNVDDLVRYGYGEYLVKVFAFPNLNDSTHAMSTAATATYSFSGAQDAPVIDYLWNTFDGTVDVQVSNIADYTYQMVPDRVEVTFVNVNDGADTVTLTMENISTDSYSLKSDALTRGATYSISAVGYSESPYVTNPTSDTTIVTESVTFAGHNVISKDYYYSDGITRMPFSYPQVTENLSLTQTGTLNSDNSSITYTFTTTPVTPNSGSEYSFIVAADCRPFTFDDATLELYPDGTFRMDQYGEMPPQGPSHIQGIWTDNGDRTVTASKNSSLRRRLMSSSSPPDMTTESPRMSWMCRRLTRYPLLHRTKCWPSSSASTSWRVPRMT